MITVPMQTLWVIGLAVVLLLVTALYCVATSRNLIRILIGVELLTKAVTLSLAAAGKLTNATALGQSLIITLVVVEVVMIAVAAGVVIGAYEHNKSLDAKRLRELKG